MTHSPTTQNLIQLADVIFEADIPLEEVLNRLDAYATLFDVWYAAHSDKLSSDAEVALLEERHHKVIECAAELLKGTSAELAKLKLKGKGILAYTDTLPKKISFRRPRKG